MRKVAIAMLLASAVGGCITSQAMPLAPNQVRIDTRAGGLLFVNQTVPTTMREAATQTLRAGYTHFKLSQAASGVGETASTSCSWGRYGGGCGDVFRPTSGASVTVTMFRANDPQAKDAFDAEQVLAQYSQ